MNAVGKYFYLVIAIVLLSSSICYPQDIDSDFQKALDMVSIQPGLPSCFVSYDCVEEAADFFVSKYTGTSAVELLQEKIEDPNSKRLALLSLAKLAPTNEAAESTLYEQIYGNNPGAVITVAYLDPFDGQQIAETLVSQPGPWHVRKAAVEMLVGFGDENTLRALRQMITEEKDPIVREAIELAIPQLEYKVTKVSPEKQVEWGRNEVLCWRTLASQMAPARNLNIVWRSAAKTLYIQGKQFGQDFLEYKLISRDLLGIAIIGYQKEAWAIPGLKEYATLGDSVGDFAREALGEIGTSEALRALEASLIPGGDIRANTRLLMLLQQHGDEVTTEFMKKLSMYERFSESEQTHFHYVYEILAGIRGRRK